MLNELFYSADQPAWTAYDCRFLGTFHIKSPTQLEEEIARTPLYVGRTMVITGTWFLALYVARLIANC
jgi:hypothetical protein